MAILEKRKSSSPRFKRYQDTKPGDRSDALSGYTSTTRPGGNLMAGTSEDTEGPGGGAGRAGGAGGAGGAGVTSRIAGQAPNVGAGAVSADSPLWDQVRAGQAAAKAKNAPLVSTAGGVKPAAVTGAKTTAATVPGAKPAVTTGTGAKTTGLTSTTLPAVNITAPPKTTLTSTGSGVKAGTTTGTTTGTAGVKTGLTGTPKLTSTVGNTSLTSTGSGVKAGTTTGTTTGTTGVKAGTTGVPKLTSTVGNTSLTSTGSGVKTGTTTGTTTGGVKTTGSTTGSTIGKALTGALTGAALGVGTKAIIDKLTGGTKTTTGGTTTGGTRTTTGGTTTGGTTTGGTTTGGTTTGGVKTTTTGGTPAVKPTLKGVPVTSVVKPTATTPLKPATLPGTAKTPTGGGAAPVGGSPIKPVAPTKPGTAGTPRGLTSATGASGDAADTVDQTAVVDAGAAYDDDGNLMPGYALDENGMPYWVGDAADEVVGDDDSISLLDNEAYDAAGNLKDGYDIDVNGDPYLVEADESDLSVDNTEDLDATAEEDLGDVTEAGPQYFTDDDGNFYDANGEFVMYADGSTYDPEGVAFTDEYGSTYNASGELIEEADHSDFTQQDELGNTYDWDGNLVSEADHSDYVSEPDEFGATYDWMGNEVTPGDYSSYLQQDPEGNNFDYYGNFVSFADGTTLADYQDNTYADDNAPYDYGLDSEEDLDFDGDGEPGKKGGLFKVGGLNEDGSEEEVSEDPISEVENDDGTITQMFADGSVITYDEDYNVVSVDGDTTQLGDTFTGNIPAVSESRMMRNFAEQGPGEGDVGNTPPEGWPAGFVSNDDGTATYVDDDGSTVTIDVDSSIVSVTDANGEIVAQNGEPVGDFAQGTQDNRQYFDDGSSIETFDDGSQIVYDSDGNVFKAVDQYETTYDDEGNAIVTDGYGNIVSVYDPQGKVIPLGGGRETGPTSITGGGGSGGVDLTPDKTPAQVRAEKIAAGQEGAATKSALDKILESIGGSGYLGAGAAGAVLGGLLGNSSLFDSGPASTNGFDMSQVGNIAPRTTDFGIGPARYVGYDQYGAPEQMPELYGKELYQNLNAPGFNEVNPGDYAAYDRENEGTDQTIPEYSTEPEYNPDENGENSLQTFDMADGGEVQPQPGMNTFYTFGKNVDPLENLRNPQPFQPAPPSQQTPGAKPPMGGLGQQMPQQMQQQMPQMPPQQMPQQMPQQPMQKPPGLRSGGLPAWSNVPLTQGRLNFRQGAAVHGAGDGQSDDIPAMLADGEYVIDADTVAQIGNGSTKAGAAALDKFRENIRSHKRAAPVNQIPPKTRALTSYLKGVK